MLWLYRLLFFPALLLSAPYYAWRMKRRGGYGAAFAERFGRVPALPAKQPGRPRVWIQAVSVGEMLAIGPLLEALRRSGPIEIYLTTTTSTGRKVAEEKYRALVDTLAYFPVDGWLFSKRAWDRIQPDLVLLTEGERWPEHLAQARARGVPAVAVNARLSDRSFRRMYPWRGFIASLWRGYARILAASELDAARFRELGFASERIEVTGNIKLDLTLRRLSADEAGSLRTSLGVSAAPLLLGSSTWPGEEKLLLEVYARLRQADPSARLLLVPRHAERRGEVESLLRGTPWTFHFRSRGSAPGEVDVLVADTTGELRSLTQLVRLVVVGKSFPPHTEGQTPVEAAALGRALVVGPGMVNFRVIVDELRQAGGLRQVSADDLAETVLNLWRDEPAREALQAAAQRWHAQNQGAVARTVAALGPFLSGRR